MNTSAHRLSNINRQIEDIKVMLSSINDILGNIQSEVDTLKAESSSKTQINSIPIKNLTLISEEELKTKLSNDTFRTARIIRQQEEEDENEYILVATDGSVCTERERRSAAFAVVFSDTSPLNIVENTQETSSSTLPEILAIASAIEVLAELKLNKAIITSDSTSAIEFISNSLKLNTDTKTTKKIFEKSKLIESRITKIRHLTKHFKVLVLLHTKAHQRVGLDPYSRLNNLADIISRESASRQLKKSFPVSTSSVNSNSSTANQ